MSRHVTAQPKTSWSSQIGCRLTQSGPLCETTHQRHAKASTCHVQQILWDDFLNTFWVFEQETFFLQKVWERICCFFRLWEVWVSAPCTFHWRSSDKIWSSIQSIRLISIVVDWFKINSQPGERWRPCLQRWFQSPWKCWAKMASAKLLSPDHQSRCTLVFTPWHLFPPRIDKSYIFPSSDFSLLLCAMLCLVAKNAAIFRTKLWLTQCWLTKSCLQFIDVRMNNTSFYQQEGMSNMTVTWSNNSCDLFLKSRL